MKNRKTALILSIIMLSAATAVCPTKVYAANETAETKTVTVGGIQFGMRLNVRGVIVADIYKSDDDTSPAEKAGIRKGDIIITINGSEIYGISDMQRALDDSDGGQIAVGFLRGDKVRRVLLTPTRTDGGKYRLGILARDTAAGIGTLTFIDGQTLMFGGLGHGVCDSETGVPLPIIGGSAEQVRLNGILRGKPGEPGQIKGSFAGQRIGKVTQNDDAGVYGVLSEIPSILTETAQTASPDEIENGKAYIVSYLSGEREEYAVTIQKSAAPSPTKNFTVTVTDERLIESTGGIVQGMSGSPIMQNGKLIGALTHVLIGDPTRGYGIYIDNMLANISVGTVYEDVA
ncbi:MAG: PDZ domain-containing protein [Clostridia bacterium]|nr:PDZ domain-containing protein [Clostridia bacterium]